MGSVKMAPNGTVSSGLAISAFVSLLILDPRPFLHVENISGENNAALLCRNPECQSCGCSKIMFQKGSRWPGVIFGPMHAA